MQDEGFADLRLNRQTGQNSENFWPSFSDIMTNIMMIFMLAMVVLMIRNLDLMRELRNSIASERSAMELARTTGEEKDSLAARLIRTEDQITHLQMQLLQTRSEKQKAETSAAEQSKRASALEEERDGLRLQLSSAKGELATLSGERSSLTQQVARLEGEKATLEQNMAQLQSKHSAIQQQLVSAQTSSQALKTELGKLQENYQSQSKELQQVQGLISVTDKRLADLQVEYDDIKVKYDKLVKPARTASGKYVVEVRYSKRGGIQYREPDGNYQPASQAALEQRLAELRDRDPDKLYIKVIFPDDSGLSYTDAWNFTTHLHRKFDYYYREPANEAKAP